MWSKIEKQVAVEMEQLGNLLHTHEPLLEKCSTMKPDAIERSALGAMLHSFYTGIENIFKRVAVEIDGEPPKGEIWHRQLLDRMSQPGKKRPAVISEDLRRKLSAYLEFRHVSGTPILSTFAGKRWPSLFWGVRKHLFRPNRK